MYLYVFVCIFVLFLYVFCMYCMYLAECVCIDAPSNFCCKKYKQIHTIQTHTYIIHTPNLHHTYTKYIQNKSVTMCIYVYLCACICMYFPFLCMCMYFHACICLYCVWMTASKDMIWRACCMCMYLHVYVCINWLSLFTRGYMCAVGLHWASRVAERTRRDHLFWNFVLFFKGRQPGSPWAKPWPTCWCSTGGCLSRARHADHTRPVCSTPPCGHAWFGEWCRNPLQEWEAACRYWHDTNRYMHIHAHTYISYLDIFGVIVS